MTARIVNGCAFGQDLDMHKSSLTAQISARILDHVRERDLTEGQHLTEQALADAFGVSRAPVRAALKALEMQGHVEARPNRGFFLRRGVEALPRPMPEPDLGDELYLKVAADRLAGLLPERVSESEVMRRYGLSRTEAVSIMTRIAGEGWAERRPGRGWDFLPTLASRDAYDKSYRFRAAVESAALLEPTFRPDPDALAEARRTQRRLLDGDIAGMPRARLFQINSEFHETVVGWSGNPFFLDTLQRRNRVRRLIEYRVTADRGRLAQQCREHLEILTRIEDGDLFRASRYLAEHIDGARRVKLPSLPE